jgi:hypothetical protein
MEIFGGLLPIENSEQLEGFINELDKNLSLKIIELCILHCQENGVFTMEESYLLYKSLTKLKE